MPMSNPTADHPHDEFGKDVIILIDDETLIQDCMAEALRGAFPHALVVGMPTIDKLPRTNGSGVALIVLKARTHRSERETLVADIRTVARHFPKVPVVAITGWDDAVSVGMAASAGAQGVIPLTASLKIAVAALQLVLAGGTYYPQPVLDNGKLNASIRDTEPTPFPPPLERRPADLPNAIASFRTTNGQGASDHMMVAFTAREADVLAALQRGRSNKWIAHHLNLSENTVKVHIRHIMRKLRATNRTEAVVLSQQWLSEPQER
ncbi:response regulator transcription factor [Microvirga subterranea]|uniref:DNA-binding NarL/FixJ family response regulator n=1 Tax=Microvirga subterranea TaxID=186651 RepID=A0A370HN51_9HYPH|nr:response regulator transcription factor [Microvirga subterranea]RDI59968.1 DNA-binding NarL/FixJ family response regulator [Microvirga subterranea]